MHRLRQRWRAVGMHRIQARLQQHLCAFLFIFGNVRIIDQSFGVIPVIGSDNSLIAPLVPQNHGQQPRVGMNRNVVDRAVGGHDGHYVTIFFDGGFPRDKPQLPILPLGNVGGITVAPAITVIHGITFERGHRPGIANGLHKRQPKARHEQRIFAVGFLHPPPARITAEIKAGTVMLTDIDRHAFAGNRGVGAIGQILIPSGGHRQGIWKQRRGNGADGVQCLLVIEHGNAQARILNAMPHILVVQPRTL